MCPDCALVQNEIQALKALADRQLDKLEMFTKAILIFRQTLGYYEHAKDWDDGRMAKRALDEVALLVAGERKFLTKKSKSIIGDFLPKSVTKSVTIDTKKHVSGDQV